MLTQTQSVSTGTSHVSLGNDHPTMIQINVGKYGLGIRAQDMLAVHDSGEVIELTSPAEVLQSLKPLACLPKNATGTWVKCSHGTVPAIRMHSLLNVEATTQRQPLVLVRTGTENQLMGLFVDSTSRPQAVASRDWVAIPNWIRSELMVPADSMVIEHHEGQSTTVRLILNPDVFHTDAFKIEGLPQGELVGDFTQSEQTSVDEQQTPTGGQTDVSTSEFGAISSVPTSAVGRGLLVFAPAESSRSRMRAAVAVPMSCVLGVDQSAALTRIPTNDSRLEGIAVWNGITVPVLRLGDAIGMIGEASSNQPETSNDETRLLIFRTPAGEVFGCYCHAQMRSLRTPTTKGLHPDCRMNEDLLHGAFLTEEGPLAVPNLDRLLHPRRLKNACST